jgi:hypothetical protein
VKIREYQQAVQSRHPFLADVWCTIDGITLMLECAAEENEQNRSYNRLTCDHYIGAVLVFCPDGMIPMCFYNVPGTVHDSNIALMGGIYAKLEAVNNLTGARCTVDSAFARNTYPFLIKSCKPTLEMKFEEMEIVKDATSMQQSSE